MVRLVLENVLLFLMPTALYIGYMMLVRKSTASARDLIEQGPLVVLFLAGLACIIATLVLFSERQGEGRAGQSYEPPVYKDGQIIPGKIK